MPDGKLVFQAPTDQPNGVRVELAVRSNDIAAFRTRIVRFYSYWNEADLPTFHGDSSVMQDITEARGTVISTGTNWVLRGEHYEDEDEDTDGPVAVMGGVPYRITTSSLPQVSARARAVLNQPLVLTFPIGALSFQASREELSYDEPTVKALLAALDTVGAEMIDKTKAELHGLASPYEFSRKFNEKHRLLKAGSLRFIADIILSETFTLADGRKVTPDKLRDSHVYISTTHHVPFNVQLIGSDHKQYVKGLQRYGLTAIAHVIMEHPGTLDPKTNRMKGAQHNRVEWFSPNLAPKPLANVNMKRRAANYLHDGHKVTSSSADMRAYNGNIAFIINDMGERGTEGIRFYREHFADKAITEAYQSGSLYFIDGFGGGLNGQATLDKFNTYIRNGVADGAPVVFLSQLPNFKFPEPPKRDFTAPKKPVQKGTIEQRFTTFTFHKETGGLVPTRQVSKLDNMYDLTFYKPTSTRDYERRDISLPMLYVPTVHGQPLNVHKDMLSNEVIGALYTLGLLDEGPKQNPQIMIGMLSDRQREECITKGVELIDIETLLKEVKALVPLDTGLVKVMQSRLYSRDHSDGARIAKSFINVSEFVKAMGPLSPSNVFVKLRDIENVVKAGLANNVKRSALVYLILNINHGVFDVEHTEIEGKFRLTDVLKFYPLLEQLNEDLYSKKRAFFNHVVAYIKTIDKHVEETEAQAKRNVLAEAWTDMLLGA